MSKNLNVISEYIKDTKFTILSTVNSEGQPSIRTLGAFGNDDLTIFFSTNKETSKVSDIIENPNVSLLFQQENQQLQTFKNITFNGIAEKLSYEEEIQQAIRVIGKKNPRFKERIEKQGLENNIIFKVEPKEIKYLNFENGLGADRVTLVKF